MSQFIEIFYGMETTPVKDYIDDSFPGEWGTEDKDGNGVKVIRTTNFTNSGKLNLADVVTRSIEDRKVVRKQIKKYDTILERSGGTADNPVGRVVLFEEDNLFLCNNFTQVLRFKDVDPRFAFYALYYFYQTNRTAIRSMGSKTTGIQNLNMSKYLEIGIPNASDEDQKAFVTIAEQADKSKFGDFKSQFIEMFGNPLSLNQKNELKRLGECCILNPRRPNIALCDTDKVSFIPMPAVSEDGYWVDMTDEEYGKVKKGFTYFENNDVLFAKITPCMENGKGAIVHGLTNGIGMGSTEFHVLRPINGISSPYWLLALTRMPIFRERAAKNMSGTGGQKRVSASYLDHFMVGLPAIEEQRRFEAIYRQADKSKFGDFKSQFIEMFGNCKSQGTLSSLCATFIDGDWIESKDQSDNGIRLIQTGNVGFGFFKGREDKSRYITEETFKKLNCTEVVPGDILISRLPDPIGRACIVPEGIGKAITAVDCTIVRLNATLLPEFLISFSKTALYASQINKIKTGTTRLRVSRGNLGNVIIPIPPIESQHHFAAIAQQADKSKSVIQKALVYLNDIQSDELRKIA